MSHSYKVVLHRSEEGISVSVPALPGCWSEGDTEEEALANIRDAISEYPAALEDQFQDAEVREVDVGEPTPAIGGAPWLLERSPRLAHPEQAEDFEMEVTEEPSNAGLR